MVITKNIRAVKPNLVLIFFTIKQVNIKTRNLLLIFLFFNGFAYSQLDKAIVVFNISEINSSAKVSCNVRIWDSGGKYLYPDSTYFWKGFMGTPFPDYPSNGSFRIKLPPGKYSYELDRSHEYYLTKGSFLVTNKNIKLNLRLKRIIDLKKRNWWSGEFHIHRKPKDIELLMKSGDLHVAPVITAWNQDYPYKNADTMYDFSVRRFDDDRFYTITGSEDERGGGAILVLNTPRPIDFSSNTHPEYPPLAKMVEKIKADPEGNHWIDIEKPFWWDMPILLSTGSVNSIGIAHNHMNQAGVFDNEAWGMPRDKNKYPPPMGNGYWTQEIYYRILNSGLRIPPSAGSASGVLLNPVGYNRVYAYIEKGLTYDKWFDAVKRGKCFVSNGPLLLCKANGELPGRVFTSDKKFEIKIAAEIYSRDTVDVVEIIKNGKVLKHIPATELKDKFSVGIVFEESGWFLIRVICKTTGNFRFASTAPFYVEIGKNKKHISKSAAQFFLDWTNERAGLIKTDDKEQLREINKYVNAARKYWEGIVASATYE